MFFIRVITRVYTRTCTWFQLRLQFVLDSENKNSKNNKEKTSLNQIKTNKKVSSIQEKFRFFVLPVVVGVHLGVLVETYSIQLSTRLVYLVQILRTYHYVEKLTQEAWHYSDRSNGDRGSMFRTRMGTSESGT